MRRVLVAFGAMVAVLAGSGVATAAVGHEPVIVSPKNGAVVSSPVTVVINLNGAQVPAAAAAGAKPMAGMPRMAASSGHDGHGEMDEGAHAHLIIDSPLPKPGTMVPMDEHHIHMMGVTRTTVTLTPGRHTLQLIMGEHDHVVPQHAPHSQKITIQVR